MKRHLIVLITASSLAIPLSADVVVSGNSAIRTLPGTIGGVMLSPYADRGSSSRGFTNTEAYQSAFLQTGPPIARLTAYPDFNKSADANPGSITANYDPKIDLIRANGAQPLFLLYTAPNNSTANSNLLVNYYVDTTGDNYATNGVSDATVATNVVFLVSHYLGLDHGHYASNPINVQYSSVQS